MSWSKKVTVGYHFIEATDDEYFIKLARSMDALLASGETSGTLDAGSSHFIWRLNGIVDITETKTYFISLVKEKIPGLVRFDDSGTIEDIPTMNGAIGELFYAFINPAGKFMLSTAPGTGAAAGNFKKFLNEHSTDGGVKLTPLFEDRIDVKTLSWDYYKKVSVSMEFPTYDELTEFGTTREGRLLGLIDEIGGLKFDLTIAAPKQKRVLNASQLRDMIKNFMVNDFCRRLIVKGADFETEALEEYDIKNAQVKYFEDVEISGSYMSEEEAIGVLRRAFADRSKELLHIIFK